MFGFGGAIADLSVSVAKLGHIKKRDEHAAVAALRGRHLVATHNNQPIVGVAEVGGKLVMTLMTTYCATRRNNIDYNGGGEEQMIRVMVW